MKFSVLGPGTWREGSRVPVLVEDTLGLYSAQMLSAFHLGPWVQCLAVCYLYSEKCFNWEGEIQY